MTDYALQHEAELLAENVYNASDREQVNNARKKEARERKEHLDYTLQIMSTKAGRKWMRKILQACKRWDNAAIMSQGNTHNAYFYLGEQNIGRYLSDDIEIVALTEYGHMLREAKEEGR